MPVPAPAERLLLVALAHISENEVAVASQHALSELTNMGAARLTTARANLVEIGVIDYSPARGGKPGTYRLVPPSGELSFTQAIQGQAPAAERNIHAEAIGIASHWWNETKPRPLIAGGFPAAKALVQRALDAGWSVNQVSDALVRTPTLSAGALEFALRNVGQQNGHRPIEPKRPKRPECRQCGSSGWIAESDARNARMIPCPSCASEY